mgnify:CR=1 FL=1
MDGAPALFRLVRPGDNVETGDAEEEALTLHIDTGQEWSAERLLAAVRERLGKA